MLKDQAVCSMRHTRSKSFSQFFFFNALIFNFNVNYTIEPFFRGPQFILLTGRALHSEQKFSQYFVSTALFSARSLRQDSLHIIQSLLRR